jgi:hypothetical protein
LISSASNMLVKTGPFTSSKVESFGRQTLPPMISAGSRKFYTQLEKLARAFSTKPAIVSVSDGGIIKHNGNVKGYVYKIIDTVTPDDIYIHPKTKMDESWEWITRKEFRLEFLYEYESIPDDILSEDEISTLRDN